MDLETQKGFFNRRVEAYLGAYDAVSAVQANLHGDGISKKRFQQANQAAQVISLGEPNKKTEDPWAVFQELRTQIVLAGHEPSLFTGSYVAANGRKYQRAEVAVEINGNVFSALVDVSPERPDTFSVQFARFNEPEKGVLVHEPYSTPIAVHYDAEREKFSIDITQGMEREELAKKFGE